MERNHLSPPQGKGLCTLWGSCRGSIGRQTRHIGSQRLCVCVCQGYQYLRAHCFSSHWLPLNAVCIAYTIPVCYLQLVDQFQ